MTQIIVHAGFHKTGTSSLQNHLAMNRQALSEHFHYYGKAHFRGAGARARMFAQRPLIWRLWHFRLGFRAFLNTIPDPPALVLSRETFGGLLPGHRGMFGRYYGYRRRAIPLARAISGELKRRFGPSAEISFLYTLRQPEPWARSIHGHLVRSIRMTDDLARFRARFPAAFDLEGEARAVARALAPMTVHTSWLEDLSDAQHGPSTAVLDLMGVPQETRDRLIPAGHANPGHNAEVLADLLHLNRTIRDAGQLSVAKESVLDSERAIRDGA